MRLTILSDIHEDIDRYYGKGGFEHDFSALQDQEFVIIAGDISGNPLNVEKFIRKNITNGVFVEGNHLGYDKSGVHYLDYKQGANKFLAEEFDGSNGVKFLENDIYIKDDVVFIGCTLYTDFNLYGNPELAMRVAQGSMNDYRYVKYEYKGEIRPLTAEATLEWHLKSVQFIEDTCLKYPDKKIIVVTHHAPSAKSLDRGYRNSSVNPAYASDLEWLIKKHTNIKLWAHGHVHKDKRYKIGQCKVVCRPYGYYNQNNRDMSKFGNRKNCLGYIIDTNKL